MRCVAHLAPSYLVKKIIVRLAVKLLIRDDTGEEDEEEQEECGVTSSTSGR